MAKAKTIYSCTECGGQVPKWQGQCPHCEAWNTLVESVAEVAASGKNRFSALAATGKVQMLAEVEAAEVPRTPTESMHHQDGRITRFPLRGTVVHRDERVSIGEWN